MGDYAGKQVGFNGFHESRRNEAVHDDPFFFQLISRNDTIRQIEGSQQETGCTLVDVSENSNYKEKRKKKKEAMICTFHIQNVTTSKLH